MANAGWSRKAIVLGLLAFGGIALWWAGDSAERSSRRQPASSPAKEPRTAAEWHARGKELAAGSRDLPGAIAAYRTALSLTPEMPEGHYGLGLALLLNGDAVGAAAEIESALSLAPADTSWRKDAEAALVLAHLRKTKGSTEK